MKKIVGKLLLEDKNWWLFNFLISFLSMWFPKYFHISRFLQRMMLIIYLQYLSIFLRWGITYIIYIFRTIVLIFVSMFITTFRLLYTLAFFRWCPQGLMAQWIKALVRSSDIPKECEFNTRWRQWRTFRGEVNRR